MNRVVAITAFALTLGGCSGSSSWMPSLDMPGSAPAANTLQFESEPAGAEARTSQGQACRTPCSMSVPTTEFSVTFTNPGFQSQSVPVRVVANNEPPDPATGQVALPRLVPNPVYVELQPAAPPPASRSRRPPPKPPAQAQSQATTQRAARPATTTARPAAVAPRPAPTVAPSPAPAPASAWPPVPSR